MNYCLNSWSAAQPASSGRNHYILARNRNVFSVETASHSSTSQVNGNVASSGLASIIPRRGGHDSIIDWDVSAIWVFTWSGTLWIHAFIHSSVDVCGAGVAAVLGRADEDGEAQSVRCPDDKHRHLAVPLWWTWILQVLLFDLVPDFILGLKLILTVSLSS